MLVKSNFIPAEIFDRFLQSEAGLKDKPITIFNDYVPSVEELQINPYNILILNEPNELFNLHTFAIQNQHVFSCILTWSQEVLDSCSNAFLFPFGMSFLWEQPEFFENIKLEDKKLKVFFVCGNKQMVEGHKFRHKVYEQKDKITIPSTWIYTCPSEEKLEHFKDSMFHVAVENVKKENFFTEKIIDAFLTRTVPVYRGCTNLDQFFDMDGVITFDTEDELVQILNSLTEEDYLKRKEAIETNYKLAFYWKDYYIRLVDVLQQLVDLNSI
jgi:hypothetical protein